MSNPAEEVWYRVSEARTTSGVRVHLRGLKVIKRTPKGVWLDDYGTKRFVLTDARKQYACKSKDEAIQSFIARKRRQSSILKDRLRTTEQALSEVLVGIISDWTVRQAGEFGL